MEQKSKMRGLLIRLIRIVLLVYLGICALVFIFQRRLLYYPTARSSEEVEQMAHATHLERWTNSAGQFVGLKRLAPNQPAKGSVLIAHGNGGSATDCSEYADGLQATAALDIFILEYPGYEDRSGSPNQTSLFQSANDAFQLLDSSRPIYLVGESLGSGVISYLAGTFPARVTGIILLSPYNRLADVAQFHYPFLPIGLMLLDRFPSDDFLRSYHGPVGIVVDGKDNIVPEKFGRRLYEGCSSPKRLWDFPDGDHITIMEPPEKFWGEVLDFWQTNLISAK
jgi:pimeloyl-ACP methyl ester carboxylesterase